MNAPETDFLTGIRRAIPARCHWAIGDDWLLESLRSGRPVNRGARGKALHGVIRFARATGLLMTAVALISGIRLIQLLIAARGAAAVGEHSEERADRIFVGFGARAEESLFNRYRDESVLGALRVDERMLPRHAEGKPGTRAVWRQWRLALADLRVLLSTLPVAYKDRVSDFATTAAKRLALYAFARVWWRELSRRRTIEEACFLAVNVHAFAAIAENVRSRFVQHGLLSKGLLLAEFSCVEPLTHFEAAYMKQVLPSAHVHLPRLRMSSASAPRTPTLLIASGNRTADEMGLALPLVQHMEGLGVTTHVRLFTGESGSRYWNSVAGRPLQISRFEGPFDELLDHLQPAFVASWGSTALAEALYRGIIPITVAADGDRLLDEMVYPMGERCLRWPADEAVIAHALASPPAYDAVLARLRLGEAHWSVDSRPALSQNDGPARRTC